MSGAEPRSESHRSEGRSTSRSLLVRLRADDEAAWKRLVDLYTPLVCHWCRRLNLSDQDMPDVYQEIFQAVMSNIQKFRRDRPQDSFRAWLRTITRSKVYDFYRRQSREVSAAGGTEARQRIDAIPTRNAELPLDEEAEDDSVDDASDRTLLFQQALQLIQRDFEPRTWQAFWKVVVDGMAAKDVALDLGMKPGTVRVAKSRVLARLRSEFGDLIHD